jgi:cerevisin
MHFQIISIFILAGATIARVAPLIEPENRKHIIPGRYIVVLKSGSDDLGGMSRQQHDSWLVNMLSADSSDDSSIEHSFEFDGVTGYTGKFSDKMIDNIRLREEVEFVEPDQIMYALESHFDSSSLFRRRKFLNKKVFQGLTLKTTLLDTGIIFKADEEEDKQKRSDLLDVQENAPWGLSRVSHANMPKGLGKYTYPKSAGKGVNAYIIDTGINIEHEDFEGRAKWGSTIPLFDEDIDGNGHGTHCAGTIGGKTYGIAKKANLFAVKVLRTSGFGTNSDVIKGVEWVIKAHKKTEKDGIQSVANMSLGGGRSLTLEKIVNKAVAAGIHFAVAAGNDNEDACNYSPAAASSPITVGASTNKDTMAFFSNHGPCVDIFAPGLDITSTWIGSKTAKNTISGTSMAAPHVAGVLAIYLGEGKYTPKELKVLLKEHATKDAISDLPDETENLLLSIEPLIRDL